MSDLPEAERDWQAVNPFVHANLQPAYEAWHRLERARVAVYERGECCGCSGVCGECDSRAVQIRRRERLADLGMATRDAGRLARLCERSGEYRDEFSGLKEVETDGQRAEVWRIWADRFIQEFGATTNDYGNDSDENSGHVDAGEVAGDGDRV